MVLMSISISTDLVLDVMKAAGPERRAAAAAKLANPQAVANQKFEAVMLRSMAEEMMPKDTSSIYGEGTAGNIWRSLQADLMSQEMAKAGGIGIARILGKTQDRVSQGTDAAALNGIITGTGHISLQATSEWPYFTAAPRIGDKS
jgi:Rod binding domain-containing protein